MKPSDVKPGLRVRYSDGVEEDTGTIVHCDGPVWRECDRSVWVQWDSDAMILWADLSNLEPLESSCDTPSTTRELTEEECVMFLLSRGYMIKGPTC